MLWFLGGKGMRMSSPSPPFLYNLADTISRYSTCVYLGGPTLSSFLAPFSWRVPISCGKQPLSKCTLSHAMIKKGGVIGGLTVKEWVMRHINKLAASSCWGWGRRWGRVEVKVAVTFGKKQYQRGSKEIKLYENAANLQMMEHSKNK